jgi:RimJ/RimL family protein N-acetyltransferase
MDKIKLRALTLSDIEHTLLWHNQDDITEFYSGHPFPVNIEMERKWYDKILTSNIPVTVFGIEYSENQKLIGITILKEINLINRSAELAIYIGDKDYRGTGISKIATLETIRFGFFKIGLNRIYLKVLEENETAIRLYETSGFKREGLMQKSVFKNNCFKNEILMSLLKEEFNG